MRSPKEIGTLANAALPGRVGELARVAVLTRHVRRPGAWATITGLPTVGTGRQLTVEYTIEVEHQEKPACVAETVVLLVAG